MISRPHTPAKYVACQTLDTTRTGCFAPSYCATKAFAYETTPTGRLRHDQNRIPAGSAAATACSEYHVSNTRSTTCISDCVLELRTIGTAMASSSR